MSALLPGSIAGIIGLLLLLADGFIFGVAAKKAITSIILIVVGLLLASFIGLVIPFLTASDVLTRVTSVLVSQAAHIGPIVYAFPVFWIIGFALGLWKG
ncbi:MAG: hypothetical protein ACREBS_05510 [Nitrososphaerales archaeon]